MINNNYVAAAEHYHNISDISTLQSSLDELSSTKASTTTVNTLTTRVSNLENSNFRPIQYSTSAPGSSLTTGTIWIQYES